MTDRGTEAWRGLRRATIGAVSAFASLALILLAAMIIGQRMIVYPIAYLHDREAPFLPAGWKEIGTGREGEDLRAYIHHDPSPEAPVLVVLHGNAATPFSIASTAAPWTRAGWTVVVPEYPGYADAPGTPDEKGIISSAIASWDHVVREGAPPERVVVLGNSIGTGPAVALAAARRPAMLMIVSGPSSMSGLMREKIPLLPDALVWDDWENQRRLSGVRAPVRIWHGRKDAVIPYEHGMRLARTAGTSVAGRDAGHELFWSNDLQEEMLRIADHAVGGARL